MGRYTKLDESIQQVFVNAIRQGLGYEPAASLAGIALSTFYNWRNRAQAELDRLEKHSRARVKKSERPFIEFLEAVQRAEAVGEQANADILNRAAEGGFEFTETKQTKVLDPATGAFVITEEVVTTKTTQPDWRAAAFILERRHPERWVKKQQTELSGPGGKPIQILSIEPVTPEDGDQ